MPALFQLWQWTLSLDQRDDLKLTPIVDRLEEGTLPEIMMLKLES